MTKIRVTALTADGDPYGNALVTVRLVDAGSGGAVGGGLVVAPQTAKTDGTTGIAIVDLTPTADVTPVGTYYAFTVNQSNPTVVRYIEVPAPNGTGDAEVPFDWDDPDLERLTATPPTHIPAPDSGVAGQVLGVVDPGDGPRYDLIDASGADAEPLFFDLTGLGPTYALDLSAVPDAVKSVTVYCDTAIALTITPPVRPDRLGLVVFVDGGGAITVAIAGGPLSLAGTSGLLAYLEPLPSGLGIDMQLGPSRDPAVASVNGQTGTVVLDADDIGAQPADSDLTAIAALTPTDDDFMQRKSGAWTNRTLAQVRKDLIVPVPMDPLSGYASGYGWFVPGAIMTASFAGTSVSQLRNQSELWMFDEDMTIAVAMEWAAASAAGKVVKLWINSASTATWQPSAVVKDFGTIATDGPINTATEFTGTYSVTRGVPYVCRWVTDGAATFRGVSCAGRAQSIGGSAPAGTAQLVWAGEGGPGSGSVSATNTTAFPLVVQSTPPIHRVRVRRV